MLVQTTVWWLDLVLQELEDHSSVGTHDDLRMAPEISIDVEEAIDDPNMETVEGWPSASLIRQTRTLQTQLRPRSHLRLMRSPPL